MNVFEKALVKTALTKRRKFSFFPKHITTTDFFKLSPVFCREMLPGEKCEVDMLSFARLDPLPVPTFGHARMYNRAFFVPFRTVFSHWNEFITDAIAYDNRGGAALVPRVVTVSNQELVQMFTRSIAFANVVTNPTPAPTTYDFLAIDYSASPVNYQYITLTPKGRQAYKILQSLGYDIFWNNNVSPSPTNDFYNQEYSAMPLLCVAKIYMDWYYPSQYYGDSDCTAIESILRFTAPAGTVLTLTFSQLQQIFNIICYSNYGADYFTSAFDNPVGPSNGMTSNYIVSDVTMPSSSGRTAKVVVGSVPETSTDINTNGTPVIGQNRASSNQTLGANISYYALEALHRLTDYMKRHQLVGARALDRYLARFGVELNADKLNRSYSLGNYVVDMEISDIMSNADTFDSTSGTGDVLGSYAGKGMINRNFENGHFEFQSNVKEYGCFIIMSSLIPDIGYVQGIDRNILHTTRLDFFTPEFDGMGTQPILSEEIYMPSNSVSSYLGTLGPEQIFGFTPRYAEYKTMRDRLTGDFKIKSISTSGSTTPSWHMFRLFGESGTNVDIIQAWNQLKHSKAFMLGEQATQFNRIFYNTNNTADKFTCIHQFQVKSYANAKALYDSYEFDYDASGNDVTVPINGSRVN